MSKKRGKRAQAAMEFLMTYGWAILVVLIAIGALAYFGVLNPGRWLPSTCTLPPGLACVEHKVGISGIVIVVQNSLGYNLVDVSVAFENCDGAVQGQDYGSELPSEKKDTYVALCDLSNIEKYKGDFTFTYKRANSVIERKKIGSIIALVEGVGEASGGVDQGVCQNAQNGGLCDGLDLVYGGGYRANCCSEYNLCC